MGASRHWRRLGGRVARLAGPLVVVLLAMAPLACTTTTIVPPADPADPVELLVLDHGRTSSLVVPSPDGQAVRYAYGDWQWYALANTSFFRGLAALLLPTQGALGRQALAGPPDEAAVRAQVGVPTDHVYAIPVERAAARRLYELIESQYARGTHIEVVQPAADLSFVKHPRPYSVLHNSNQVVAGWLRTAGCEVRGPTLISRWRVQPPGKSPPSVSLAR